MTCLAVYECIHRYKRPRFAGIDGWLLIRRAFVSGSFPFIAHHYARGILCGDRDTIALSNRVIPERPHYDVVIEFLKARRAAKTGGDVILEATTVERTEQR